MCGRFANQIDDLGAWEEMLDDWPFDASTGFNVSPTQMIPAITAEGGHVMRWGLIPGWSKEITSKYATFNARLDTVATKPAFRNAWRKSQRCLIPVRGYYEWRTEGGQKQPYYIHPSDGSPLVMAGIWEPEHSDIPHSCSIITTEANTCLEHIHTRMPLFVSASVAQKWLSGECYTDALFTPADYETIDAYKVSREVNNSRSQASGLVNPIT